MNTEIIKLEDFELTACQIGEVMSDRSYKKITTGDKNDQILNAVSQLFGMGDAVIKANAYIARFPKGLPHDLMNFKAGGYGSAIMGDKGIVGHASFMKLGAASSIFTALSVITTKYYLDQINNKLNDLNKTSEKILNFLQQDKKAELNSEIQFVNRALNNYENIIDNEMQRASTITSLQSTQKVSFKDCLFYSEELRNHVYIDGKSDIEKDVQLAFEKKYLLEISLKLYILSTILEAYYAQNNDTEYLNKMKTELNTHIEKCEKQINSSFKHLKSRINNTYDTWFWQFKNRGEVLEDIYKLLESHRNGMVAKLQKDVIVSIALIHETKQYYIERTGNVYVRTTLI